MSELQTLHVVFDGPPGPTAGRFVEVESDAGKSLIAGDWKQRPDGMWELLIRNVAVGGVGEAQALVTWRDAQSDPPPYELDVMVAWRSKGALYMDFLQRAFTDKKGTWYDRRDNSVDPVLGVFWCEIKDPETSIGE